MVLEIVSSIPKDLDYSFENPEVFTREVTIAFAKHMPQIKVMFSGKSLTHLAIHLEAIIKKIICSKYPEYGNDMEKNILLSYCIHGAYNASLSNPNADPEVTITADFHTLLRPTCGVTFTHATPDLQAAADYLTIHQPFVTLLELRTK